MRNSIYLLAFALATALPIQNLERRKIDLEPLGKTKGNDYTEIGKKPLVDDKNNKAQGDQKLPIKDDYKKKDTSKNMMVSGSMINLNSLRTMLYRFLYEPEKFFSPAEMVKMVRGAASRGRHMATTLMSKIRESPLLKGLIESFQKDLSNIQQMDMPIPEFIKFIARFLRRNKVLEMERDAILQLYKRYRSIIRRVIKSFMNAVTINPETYKQITQSIKSLKESEPEDMQYFTDFIKLFSDESYHPNDQQRESESEYDSLEDVDEDPEEDTESNSAHKVLSHQGDKPIGSTEDLDKDGYKVLKLPKFM